MYDFLKNQEKIFTEEFYTLLPDYLLQLTVQEANRETLISFFEISKIDSDVIEKDLLDDNCIYLEKLGEAQLKKI